MYLEFSNILPNTNMSKTRFECNEMPMSDEDSIHVLRDFGWAREYWCAADLVYIEDTTAFRDCFMLIHENGD